MENYDSNIMPSSNNNKELEVRIYVSCRPKFSCKGLSLCMAAKRGEHCVSGVGRSIPALLRRVGSGPDLGEEPNWRKEGGTSQPPAYHKCVLYCNIKHWLILCFLLKQVIKGLLKGDSIPIFYIYPQSTCGVQIMVANLSPPLRSFPPHQPIHLCDLIRKRTELVLTQEGLLIYSEMEFQVQAYIYIYIYICIYAVIYLFVYFLTGRGKERDAHLLGNGCQGERSARGGGSGSAGGGAPGREEMAFGVGWDIIDSREELSQ